MTTLVPYRYRNSLRNVDDWMREDFFRPFFWGMEPYSGSFRVDVRDEGDHYLLEADLPGMTRDQIHVDVEDGMLTISTECEEKKDEQKERYVYNERRAQCMRRSFTLNQIDEEKINAEYAGGVLTLTLPKIEEAPSGGRRIDIQ